MSCLVLIPCIFSICSGVVCLNEVQLANNDLNRWLARQDRKISGAMKAYSEYVKAAKGGWLVGDTYTIADIAVGCAVEWVDFFELCKGWREEHPELATWWEKLSRRESFKDTVPVMFDMKDPVI